MSYLVASSPQDRLQFNTLRGAIQVKRSWKWQKKQRWHWRRQSGTAASGTGRRQSASASRKGPTPCWRRSRRRRPVQSARNASTSSGSSSGSEANKGETAMHNFCDQCKNYSPLTAPCSNFEDQQVVLGAVELRWRKNRYYTDFRFIKRPSRKEFNLVCNGGFQMDS